MDEIKRKLTSGLSLIELQIAMAIFAAMTLVVGTAYYTSTRIINEERNVINISSENRLAINEITNQIREAVDVITNCATCGSSTNSDSTTLILSLWSIDSSGNLFEPTSGDYDYLVYRLENPPNGTNLLKEVFANGTTSSRINTSKILASDVKSVTFTYDNADPSLASEVALTITNETDSFVKTHTISESSKANLRNK